MTGAGFGGCTAAIINEEDVDNYIETVGTAFKNEFGHAASFYVTETGNGRREV